MPQLDTTTFFSQIFFTFIIFLFFYGNMVNWVIPSINSFLQVRKKKIAQNYTFYINFIFLLNFISFFKTYQFNKKYNDYIINLKSNLI